MRRNQRSRLSRRDRRGAISLLVAPLLGVVMVCGALVVDLGLQRVIRADLQALADVVALDLARELDGRSAAELEDPLDGVVEAAIERNPDLVGDSPPEVSFRLGDVGVAGGFVLNEAGPPPTAVEVVARGSVDFAFAGVTGAESGAASRRAVAAAEQSACYSVGSYAAAVNTGGSTMLDPLLKKLAEQTGAFSNGWGVAQAIGYQGLLNATVRLGVVALAAGVASVDELADTTLSARSWFVALKSAYGTTGNATTLAMLDTLAVQAVLTKSVQVGRVLGIDSGSGSLADLRMNLLDLTMGALSAINGTNVLSINLPTAIPGLANGNAQITLIQGPRTYCGRPGSSFTTGHGATTQQLSVRVTASFNPAVQTVALPTSGLLPLGASVTAPVPSYVDTQVSLAATDTTLTGVSCAGGGSGGSGGSGVGVELEVENRLVTASITNLQLSEAVFTARLALAGLEVLTAQVRVGTANANVNVTLGSTGTTDFSLLVPPRSYDTFYPTQSGGVGMSFSLNGTPYVEVRPVVLGQPTWPALSLTGPQQRQIADLVAEAVLGAQFAVGNASGILNTLVKPLLGMAGASLAGSDVSLLSTPPVDCGAPVLRG